MKSETKLKSMRETKSFFFQLAIMRNVCPIRANGKLSSAKKLDFIGYTQHGLRKEHAPLHVSLIENFKMKIAHASHHGHAVHRDK